MKSEYSAFYRIDRGILLASFQITMVVYRDESVANGTVGKEDNLLDVIDVELTKKQGKGLGLSIVGRKNGNGVFISDIVSTGNRMDFDRSRQRIDFNACVCRCRVARPESTVV